MTNTNTQTAEEVQSAELLFEETFRISPSQYDEYGVYDVEEWGEPVEVHVCKETLWHYIYLPAAPNKQYYILIDRCDQLFDNLEELKRWAKPLYFK